MSDQTFYWSGYCSAHLNALGLISVMNTSDVRQSTLKVEHFDVMPWAPGPGAAGASGRFCARRVTGVSMGGVAVTPVRLDGPGSLPAQVQAYVHAPVQYATEIPFNRNTPFGAAINLFTGVFDLTNVRYGSSVKPPSGAVDLTSFGTFGYGSTDVQGVKLNAGEGFAVLPYDDALLPHRLNGWLTVLFRDDTNGHTYSVMSDLTSSGSAGVASFVLFNGAGSGVVLTVLSVSVHLQSWGVIAGSAQYYVDKVKFIRTRGNALEQGESITMLSPDPRVTAPAALSVQRAHYGTGLRVKPIRDISGGYEDLVGMGTGGPSGGLAQTAILETRRSFDVVRQCNLNHRVRMLNSTGFMMTEMMSLSKYGDTRKSRTQTQPITLGPGQGFAAIIDGYMGDRTFASFNQGFHDPVMFWVELALTYNSGVAERSQASI